MQITVKGRHVEVSEEVKKYAHEKAEKLLKFYDRIQSIEVIAGSEGDEFSIEVIVNAGARTEFVAHEVGPEPLALIDLTSEKVERQILRHKEMVRNHKHPGK